MHRVKKGVIYESRLFMLSSSLVMLYDLFSYKIDLYDVNELLRLKLDYFARRAIESNDGCVGILLLAY